MLGDLYQKFDIVVLSRHQADKFRCLTQPTDWLLRFLPAAKKNDLLAVGDCFPYIDNFLVDAEQHWLSVESEQLKSGPWLETDANKQVWALEATALCHEGESLLLLQYLGKDFQKQQQQLQIARENLLTQEILEQEVRKRTADIRNREEEIAMRMVAAAVYRDEETGAHIRRIGHYSAEMGRALNWPIQQIDDMRIAAPMHDIGKIGIPDNVLRKPGKLTASEMEIMQRHAAIGGSMLAGTGIALLDLAAEIAHNHHERWDGSGYPQGLHGQAIPESARIVAIVDVYDALVHKRVYKEAFSESESLKIMDQSSGTHFDPDLYKLFISLLPVMHKIRETIRDDGE